MTSGADGFTVGGGETLGNYPGLSNNPGLSAYTLRYGRWVMIAKLLDALFGCKHSRYSFPVTIRRAKRRPQAAALTGTYVVCLDCGRKFAYDWQNMKMMR